VVVAVSDSNWHALTPDELVAVARRVCTEKQLEVIRLRETGLGWKAIALMLGVGPDTVRDHYRRAVANVNKEADRVEALRRDPAGPASPGTCADG
jgi:DNA-binding NarL/FixJ family response regulator